MDWTILPNPLLVTYCRAPAPERIPDTLPTADNKPTVMSQKSSASLSSASTDSITLEYTNAIPADIITDTAYFKEKLAENKDDETDKSVYPQPEYNDH